MMLGELCKFDMDMLSYFLVKNVDKWSVFRFVPKSEHVVKRWRYAEQLYHKRGKIEQLSLFLSNPCDSIFIVWHWVTNFKGKVQIFQISQIPN